MKTYISDQSYASPRGVFSPRGVLSPKNTPVLLSPSKFSLSNKNVALIYIFPINFSFSLAKKT